jgi:hypothetical protein
MTVIFVTDFRRLTRSRRRAAVVAELRPHLRSRSTLVCHTGGRVVVHARLWISRTCYCSLAPPDSSSNMILDLLFIRKVHVGRFKPTTLTQAGIRLACERGLVYFVYVATETSRRISEPEEQVGSKINLKSLVILARPAVYTFTESAVRNSIYLWLVSTIIALGQDYATAWVVFNTIR